MGGLLSLAIGGVLFYEDFPVKKGSPLEALCKQGTVLVELLNANGDIGIATLYDAHRYQTTEHIISRFHGTSDSAAAQLLAMKLRTPDEIASDLRSHFIMSRTDGIRFWKQEDGSYALLLDGLRCLNLEECVYCKSTEEHTREHVS